MAEAVEEKEAVETREGSGQSTPQQPLDKGGDPKSTPKGDEKKEGTEAASPAPIPRTRKVTVDGEEREVTEDELVKDYELRQASYNRFKETSQLKKDIEKHLEMIARDPRQVMIETLAKAKYGGDRSKALKEFRDLSVQAVREMMEEEGLSPEARASRQKDSELSSREQELKAREEEINRKSEAEEIKSLEAKIEQELPGVIDKAGFKFDWITDPKLKDRADKIIQKGILGIWQQWNEAGHQIPFERCAEILKSTRNEAAIELSHTLKQEEFEKFFQPQIEAWHKKKVESLRSGSNPTAPNPSKGVAPRRTGRPDPKGKSASEYSRALTDYLESNPQ